MSENAHCFFIEASVELYAVYAACEAESPQPFPLLYQRFGGFGNIFYCFAGIRAVRGRRPDSFKEIRHIGRRIDETSFTGVHLCARQTRQMLIRSMTIGFRLQLILHECAGSLRTLQYGDLAHCSIESLHNSQGIIPVRPLCRVSSRNSVVARALHGQRKRRGSVSPSLFPPLCPCAARRTRDMDTHGYKGVSICSRFQHTGFRHSVDLLGRQLLTASVKPLTLPLCRYPKGNAAASVPPSKPSPYRAVSRRLTGR